MLCICSIRYLSRAAGVVFGDGGLGLRAASIIPSEDASCELGVVVGFAWGLNWLALAAEN